MECSRRYALVIRRCLGYFGGNERCYLIASGENLILIVSSIWKLKYVGLHLVLYNTLMDGSIDKIGSSRNLMIHYIVYLSTKELISMN
uniref:AlNc14C391G11293 protein n=1 Tax=Albugo laibachii Nc14 TaxID=890382 RepID=F0WYN0_9STRA|nr:AlNc14C391G11293 [Albugo laibachii Nc14]|eukprot:CCA26589.1 AlNc14C391G11293 [Albugo laibachii Nc14]